MRENRTYGSEGGEGIGPPRPYQAVPGTHRVDGFRYALPILLIGSYLPLLAHKRGRRG